MRLVSEIAVLLIIIIIAYWVFLISDIPAGIILAIIVGLTSGLIYRFIIKKEEKTIKLTIPHLLSPEKLLVASFTALLFTFLASPINDIYLANWLAIPATNWIRFMVVSAFCTFIPGFILVKLVDQTKELPTSAIIVLSVLSSILFTSIFWYVKLLASFPDNLTQFLFALSHMILIVLYIRSNRNKRKSDKTDSARRLNLNVILTLGSIVLLSISLIFIQQFIYNPFIRGDNWGYLSTSNYIDKNAFALNPVGKFYSIGPLFFYELFNLGLFRLSGFPPVNSMMVTSLVLVSMIPIAFYIMSIRYTKNNKSGMLATFIYLAMSGFSWIPFIAEKFGLSVRYYSPQDLLTSFTSIAPKVLNGITQPQGLVPEGFKKYMLATLAIIMLLYLLESKLPSKARAPFVAAMAVFAFLIHLEEITMFALIFVPAYVLLSKRKLDEIRTDIAAIAVGVLLTYLLSSTYPAVGSASFTSNYVLIAIGLASAFGCTFIKGIITVKPLSYKLRFVKPTVFGLVCYFYLLSVIILVFYGYANMYYGGSVVSLGFTFPWYYYPLSFGVVGVLVLIGLSMDFQKEERLIFLLLTILLLLIFGRLLSFINVNFFFTGAKEWRIIHRILPIPASLFAGWVLCRLMRSLNNAQLLIRFKNTTRNFKFHLQSVSAVLFILVIVLGIPSTILASEYWMVSDATSLGEIHITTEDIEAANFIYQQIPMTSRIATLSYRSNAVVQLAGGTAAIPMNYPDLLSAIRPETVALLSSDVRYVYLDKEVDAKLVKSDLVSYLPLVWNNSRVTISELPYLEPSTSSNTGYIAPSLYADHTLLSYMFIASLNSSYQVICDDIYAKSLLFLPSDLPQKERCVLNFNGVNDYVDFGDILNFESESFTVEAWFKTSSSGNFMSLINKRQSGLGECGYRILIRGDTGKITSEFNDGSGAVVAYGNVHNDGKWHQVVSVYDREGTVKLYVDNSIESQNDISNKMGKVVTDCPLSFGSEAGLNMFFNGSLSSVRIYNHTLSENEISRNYANPYDPVKNNLTLWLPLDDATGSIAHDLSNYGHNGLIHGATWSLEPSLLDSMYQISFSKILDWVKAGGVLVVLGDKGEVYNSFGLKLGDYVEANEISVGNEVHSFDEIPPFRTLIPENDSAEILSYYSFNGLNISPFALQKQIGAGKLIYIYSDPMNSMVNAQQNQRFTVNNVALILKESLEKANLSLNSSSTTSARFPLEKRWIGRYSAYGENDFVAEGNITINSTLSGSYLLQNPLTADEVLINSIQKRTTLQNVTINRINVIGEVELEILSSSLKADSEQPFSIPSYIPLQLENCTLKVRPMNGSKLEIQIGEESFSINNGELIVKLSSALFVVNKPQINVNGHISFDKVSLPFTEGAWTSDVKLVGNITFYIDYNDGNYFFSDEIKGAYSTEIPSIYPKELDIPWKEIVTSPFQILILSCLISFLLLKWKKREMTSLAVRTEEDKRIAKT
jgi:hypothetical protein